VRLDRGARAPVQLAVPTLEEDLTDGLRQVHVVGLGGGLLLLADRRGRTRLAVRVIPTLGGDLGDVLVVPVVGRGLLQSSVVALGPELQNLGGLRLAGGQGLGRHLALGLSGAGQTGGQETSGQNGATGRKEDALQGNSLRCRGTPLASHASVKG